MNLKQNLYVLLTEIDLPSVWIRGKITIVNNGCLIFFVIFLKEIAAVMKREKVKGFKTCIASTDYSDGLAYLWVSNENNFQMTFFSSSFYNPILVLVEKLSNNLFVFFL